MDIIQNRKVIKAYQKQRDDMIDLVLNDKIEVYKVENNGWSKGKNLNSKKTGWFPHTFTILDEHKDDSEYYYYSSDEEQECKPLEKILQEQLDKERQLRQQLLDTRQQKQLNIQFNLEASTQQLQVDNLALKQELLSKEEKSLKQKILLLKLLQQENVIDIENNLIQVNYKEFVSTQKQTLQKLQQLTNSLIVSQIPQQQLQSIQKEVSELNKKVVDKRLAIEQKYQNVNEDSKSIIKKQQGQQIVLLQGIDVNDLSQEYQNSIQK